MKATGRHVSTKVATVEQAATIAKLLHDAGWDAWHEGGTSVCVGCSDGVLPIDCSQVVLVMTNRVDEAGIASGWSRS